MKSMLLAGVWVSWLCGSDSVLNAQESDPFKGGGDPFRTPAVEPAKSRPGTKENGQRQKQLENENMELRIALDNKDLYLKQAAQVREEQKQELQHRIAKLHEQNAIRASVHNELFNRLLTSGDDSSLDIGLNYLANLDDLDENRSTSVRLNREARATLEQLVDSDDRAIRALAEDVVVAYHPQALELGYQRRTDRWRPLPNESKGQMLIRSKMSNLCTLDYDQTELKEVLEELQRNFKIYLLAEGSIDLKQQVTYKGFVEPISGALSAMLGQHELTYRIRHDHLQIVAKDHPDARISQTFCVRGLLTDSMNIQSLDGKLNNRFPDSETDKIDFEVVDEYRVVVTATEDQQDRVSKYLATVARGK